MTLAAHALPRAPAKSRRQRFGEVDLEVAELEPRELAAIAGSLEGLGGSVEERARVVARAARRLRDAADPIRRMAEEIVAATIGASRPMVAAALGALFAPLDAAALAAVVSRAHAPFVRRLAIVGAGNVPGVAIAKTALALVAGVGVLVKPSTAEPFTSVAFARALAEEDDASVGAHAVVWWPGGSLALEQAAFAAVDGLVAYGSDETILALERLRPRIFVGHGHRVSAAVVRLDGADLERVAAAAARDVALHDQQGCLSPQAVYVIGADRERLDAFVGALAAALQRLAATLPRGRVEAGVHVAIRRFREAFEWRAIRGEPVDLRQDAGGTAWTVAVDPDPRLAPIPLHRTIVVRPVGSTAELEPALAMLGRRLESLGLWPAEDAELASLARRLHVPRCAALGAMQEPGLDWRQGGRDPLAGLVDEGESRDR